MYLNAQCPYCKNKFKKFSLSVIKPGIVTCPHCKKMLYVTGITAGMTIYCLILTGSAVVLSPYKNRLNDTWLIFIILGALFILAGYGMSLFLGLKK
jgi:uncharacterized protein YbaR (Trm112 family)